MKQSAIIGLFIALVVVGGGLFLAQQQGFLATTDLLGGANTLSLDRVDLTSSYGPLSGEKWVFTFSLGGLAQYVEGERLTKTVGADEAAAKNAGGEAPSERFTINVALEDQQCVYPIYNTNEDQVYYFNIAEEKNSYFTTSASCEAADLCGLQVKFASMFDRGYVSTTCYQLCGTPVTGQTGRFDSPDINSDYRVELKVDGKTPEVKSFSTLDGGVNGAVGPNTYVQWGGSLSSDKSCPDKDPYKPLYLNGAWKIVSQSSYDSYLRSFVSLTEDQITTIEVLRSKVDATNSLATSATRGVSFADSLINGQSTSTAKAVIELNEALSFPVITAYVDADWLTVVTPIGKPDIVWANSPTFGSGSGGLVNALVKNVGDEGENFRMYLQCPSGWSSTAKTQYFEGGQSRELSLELSAQTDDAMEAECVLVAQGTAFQDTETVAVSVVNYATCVPGALYCFDGDVRRCDETGTKYLVVNDCSNGCETKDGTPVCIEKQSGSGGGDEVNKVLLLVAGILALVAGGAVYGYTPFLTGSSFLKITRVVVAVAAAVAVFFIVPVVVGGVLDAFRIAW